MALDFQDFGIRSIDAGGQQFKGIGENVLTMAEYKQFQDAVRRGQFTETDQLTGFLEGIRGGAEGPTRSSIGLPSFEQEQKTSPMRFLKKAREEGLEMVGSPSGRFLRADPDADAEPEGIGLMDTGGTVRGPSDARLAMEATKAAQAAGGAAEGGDGLSSDDFTRFSQLLARGQQPTPTSNTSLPEFMAAAGYSSNDLGARRALATNYGIPNYTGTPEQDAEILSNLRNSFATNQGLASATATGPTDTAVTSLDAITTTIGTTASASGHNADPVSNLGDYVKDFLDYLGDGELSAIIENEADELEKLENKRDREVRQVNDDPWLTEGARVRRVEKTNEKYQDEIRNREAKLARLQSNKQLMAQQAQWAMGTAIQVWDSDRRFDAAQAQALYERTQDALEWDYKEKVFDAGIEQYEQDYQFKVDQAEQDQLNAERGFDLQERGLAIDRYQAETSRINALTSAANAASGGLDATTRRQLTESVNSSDILLGMAMEYQQLIRDKGYSYSGPFGDRETAGQVGALRGQMIAEYKKAKQLGTLDAGVITLMDSIIGEEPISGVWTPLTNVAGSAALRLDNQVGTFIDNLIIQRNRDAARLGMPLYGTNAVSNPNEGEWESSSGNVYILPSTSQTSTQPSL